MIPPISQLEWVQQTHHLEFEYTLRIVHFRHIIRIDFVQNILKLNIFIVEFQIKVQQMAQIFDVIE